MALDVQDILAALARRLGPRVTKAIAELDTEGGRLVRSPQNIQAVARLLTDLRATMLDSEYIEAVADFVNEFDIVAFDVREALKDLGEVDPALTDAIAREFKTITAEQMVSTGAFARTLTAPLADMLIGGVAGNVAVRALLGRADDIVEGITGTMDQIAAGAPKQLERTLTVAAADQLGVVFFRYQGRPIKTTREFCREREGHVWHRKEIEQWGRDAAAGNGWAGMVPGTNEATIFTYLGGYYGGRQSCRHTLVPVAWIDVPKEDRERMVKKGLVDASGK